ncbi:MAG: sugar phosphate nucleotidyltransferase [Planctomycetota bacterium]|jgi:UTP-glucose-1-phosphate uridylyltransferase
MFMKPTLIILAAGMGSRYGKLKQFEQVGPGGETIMDYAVYDAVRGGFGKIVFVIRADMKAEFTAAVCEKYEQRIPVACALQEPDGLPAGYAIPRGRTKPWGTGHAVLSAATMVDGPFAVVNADDFYGAQAYGALGTFLRQENVNPLPAYALVGYALRDTLSDAGGVNRGHCRRSPDGWLEHITEITDIHREGEHGRITKELGPDLILDGSELVSMNAWGFQPVVFEQLRQLFEEFLESNHNSPTAEFYLPSAVEKLVQDKRVRVKVLTTSDEWFGITFAEDKPRVVKSIGDLIERGVYPRHLWD